ncbi:hypothetical protein GOBAR_AA15275 [Gossypium barbadense]|uniref:Uncharacterized protein n=1 Tax=Gossypium barbadense TaxID=3634 RepID=A0A2P5XPY2_GOSBA|nr:hypothetical protein GOBAR_AA15275 [Gossypium barbadense]
MLSTAGGGMDRRRFNGLCDFCKIRGHKKENCYRLIGYLADFKFTRKKGPSGSMTTSSSIIESDLVSGSTDSPGVLLAAAPSFTSE